MPPGHAIRRPLVPALGLVAFACSVFPEGAGDAAADPSESGGSTGEPSDGMMSSDAAAPKLMDGAVPSPGLDSGNGGAHPGDGDVTLDGAIEAPTPDAHPPDPGCKALLSLPAIADAWLNALQQGMRFGAQPVLTVGAVAQHRSLLRFAISGNPNLEGLEFTRAELRLTIHGGTASGGIALRVVTVDWLEDRATWNRGREGVGYDWVGGQFEDVDRAVAVVPFAIVDAAEVVWNVTDLVREELGGMYNFGWIVLEQEGGGLAAGEVREFHSREVANGGPRLVFSSCAE